MDFYTYRSYSYIIQSFCTIVILISIYGAKYYSDSLTFTNVQAAKCIVLLFSHTTCCKPKTFCKSYLLAYFLFMCIDWQTKCIENIFECQKSNVYNMPMHSSIHFYPMTSILKQVWEIKAKVYFIVPLLSNRTIWNK